MSTIRAAISSIGTSADGLSPFEVETTLDGLTLRRAFRAMVDGCEVCGILTRLAQPSDVEAVHARPRGYQGRIAVAPPDTAPEIADQAKIR